MLFRSVVLVADVAVLVVINEGVICGGKFSSLLSNESTCGCGGGTVSWVSTTGIGENLDTGTTIIYIYPKRIHQVSVGYHTNSTHRINKYKKRIYFQLQIYVYAIYGYLMYGNGISV